MAASSATPCLPYALSRARQSLCDSLDTGIREFKKNLTCCNNREICLSVEWFVDELSRIPAWQAELERRAGWVRTSCGPQSEFRRVMEAAWKVYRDFPKTPFGREPSPERLYFARLRKRRNQPIFLLAQVGDMRQELERVIKSGFLKRRVNAAFQRWLERSQGIQCEGWRLEVDGCWCLYNVHQAADPSPSDAAKCAKDLVESSLGGGSLEWMLAAAESLVSWIQEDPEADPPKVTPRATVNERMKAELAVNMQVVKGWTAQKWAYHLGCGKTTVIESQTWKELSLLRQQAKAEKCTDRHRRKK